MKEKTKIVSECDIERGKLGFIGRTILEHVDSHLCHLECNEQKTN